MCTSKTSPCVPAPRAQMFQHVCAWCRYTRGRFGRTHGDVFSGHTGFSACHTHTPRPQRHTQHNTTTRPQHHTETETETDRDRQRQTETEKEDRDRERREDGRGETRQEKREDSFCSVVVHGLFCWCSDFLVSPICARDLSLLNSVKYDAFLISVHLGRSTVFYYLRINFSMQLQFRNFPNYLVMQLQFFFCRN